ncbi:MAG TPA: STAS domain-containing protein [Candidatus Aquilonibacter sp.]|nr:STAS domain-containing protein [Candidatus Aquilonibacter sp.]
MTQNTNDHVITLRGDLGLIDVARVQALFPEPSQIENRVVLDCAEATSMDSSILALIMTYRQRVQLSGRNPREAIVAIASPRLVRLFELTGISRVITVVPAVTDGTA